MGPQASRARRNPQESIQARMAATNSQQTDSGRAIRLVDERFVPVGWFLADRTSTERTLAHCGARHGTESLGFAQCPSNLIENCFDWEINRIDVTIPPNSVKSLGSGCFGPCRSVSRSPGLCSPGQPESNAIRLVFRVLSPVKVRCFWGCRLSHRLQS